MLHEDGSVGCSSVFFTPFLPFFSYPILHFYSKLLFVFGLVFLAHAQVHCESCGSWIASHRSSLFMTV